jgi:hypothetical protein
MSNVTGQLSCMDRSDTELYPTCNGSAALHRPESTPCFNTHAANTEWQGWCCFWSMFSETEMGAHSSNATTRCVACRTVSRCAHAAPMQMNRVAPSRLTHAGQHPAKLPDQPASSSASCSCTSAGTSATPAPAASGTTARRPCSWPVTAAAALARAARPPARQQSVRSLCPPGLRAQP